jgi:hypothetical protein
MQATVDIAMSGKEIIRGGPGGVGEQDAQGVDRDAAAPLQLGCGGTSLES